MVLKIKWQPPEHWKCVKALEMHTGGEPLRVFLEGMPDIKGATILEKSRYFKEHFDFLRTGTLWEPRGHADMYGAVLTDPVTEDGDFGVFFLHNEGYSSMCGHAIIALTKVVVETGIIKNKTKNILFDTPSGRVVSSARLKEGRVVDVSFRNVPSFLYIGDESVHVSGLGRVSFDVAFGGAFYAFVNAKEVGLNLDASDYSKIIDYGKRIKNAVSDNFNIRHPKEPELSFLYGTIFVTDPYDYKNHSRNVCVFANGEVDRSATGTGISARAAMHYFKGELEMKMKIRIESILGTTMDVQIVEEMAFGSRQAVIPEVTGQAWYTGKNELWFDPDDPLKEGFIFR